MKTPASIMIAMVLFLTTTVAQTIKGTYAIKNVQTGMLLRIKDANTKTGTPIVLYEPQNWKCMTWDFKHIDGNTYQLENLFSGKTMQASGTKEGSNFDEQPIEQAKASQLYDFEPAGKNIFLIKLKGTEQYITPAGEGAGVNSLVKLAPRRGDKSQQWTIYQQSPTM
ncbi:hypothetical protein D0C36_08875 [Mucilaginibacter conchicola]|uniref:Ricin B lectin domain-containing protein n=1 Tax=Mucilaginibacter conchicola TaxID=2303333 RepID=A0A372P009_9SPHI|nr:RICIN domain-containing protein [Mucilaginibacter conchicola]RFZ95612.1 hypothetical protein D0C36_08875 [Mucilaginibacter conchicola]